MRNPFRYFNSSPEVIRLAVMMYIRFLSFLKTPYSAEPLSLLIIPSGAEYLPIRSARG